MAERILLGVVGRPHGVRGLVRVQSYTADPADLARYAPLQDDQGRVWSLAWRTEGVAELRDAQGKPLADRDQAQRLTNMRLYVDRDRLPAPQEDEFYLADLVGLGAVDAQGVALGRVTAVHDYGAGASLEIEPEKGASRLIPFTRACVPQVDLTARQLVVCPPDETEARE